MEKKCNDFTFVNNYKRVLLKKIIYYLIRA